MDDTAGTEWEREGQEEVPVCEQERFQRNPLHPQLFPILMYIVVSFYSLL